jgi:CHAT domain-containing protein
VLAGQDELTVAELVGMRLGANLAVLSACDTGRGAATLGGDVVGLTRALLAAGVRQTVVSLWPVDDVVACLTMVAFYDELAQGKPPAPALHDAQTWIHALDVEAIWNAHTDLANAAGVAPGPSAVEFRRRRDFTEEEVIPAPLTGSAERWWAPLFWSADLACTSIPNTAVLDRDHH